MLRYVPKVMIYRSGKYAPYRGPTQDIEMTLKFVNNDDTSTERVEVGFEELDDALAEDMV